MSQSRSFVKHPLVLTVSAGVSKELSFDLSRDTDIDLTSSSIYSTVILKVWKPDETEIISAAGRIEDRAAKIVTVEVTAEHNAVENVGFWEGQLQFFNTESVKTNTTLKFNYEIISSP